MVQVKKHKIKKTISVLNHLTEFEYLIIFKKFYYHHYIIIIIIIIINYYYH